MPENALIDNMDLKQFASQSTTSLCPRTIAKPVHLFHSLSEGTILT